MNRDRSVRDVPDRYWRAVLAKDVEAFVALHDADARGRTGASTRRGAS